MREERGNGMPATSSACLRNSTQMHTVYVSSFAMQKKTGFLSSHSDNIALMRFGGNWVERDGSTPMRFTAWWLAQWFEGPCDHLFAHFGEESRLDDLDVDFQTN